MPKKSELKCYFGCTNDGSLHRFPVWVYPHEEKFNSWKAVLNQATQRKSNEYVYNNIRLCYRHFRKCYLSPSHRLTRNAVPTLNLCSTSLASNETAHVTAVLQKETLITTTEDKPETETISDAERKLNNVSYTVLYGTICAPRYII